MGKQTSLFGNIKVAQPKKSRNKALLEKAKAPSRITREERKIMNIREVYDVKIPEYLGFINKYRPDVETELITDQDRLKEYWNNVVSNGIVAYDTESTGLDPTKDNVVGICLYTPGENPAYVPVSHAKYDKNVDVAWLIDDMTKRSKDGLKVLMANAGFDVRLTKRYFEKDEYINTHWDCILAAKFLNENESSHALKYLWNKYVIKEEDETVWGYSKLFGKFGYDIFDPEKVYYYAAMDGLETYEVYEFQKPFLDGTSELCEAQDLVDTSELYKLELLVTEVVASMTDRGIGIDENHSNKLLEDYSQRMEIARMAFEDYVEDNLSDKLQALKKSDPESYDKLDYPINPGSTKQLGILFFDALGLTNNDKSRSTDEGHVKELVKKYPEHNKLFDILIEFRGLKKLVSTYILAIPKKINPETNKVHTELLQYGAVTGRFSSKNPKSELGLNIVIY